MLINLKNLCNQKYHFSYDIPIYYTQKLHNYHLKQSVREFGLKITTLIVMDENSSHMASFTQFFSDTHLTVQLDHVHAGVSLCHSEQGSEVGAAGCQHRAVGLEVSATHHDDTVPQLTMDTLVVELLKDLFKVAWEIHCPERQTKERLEGIEFSFWAGAES